LTGLLLAFRVWVPVSSSSQSPQGLRFGIFEIDLDARELRKNGLRVKLQDQPFKILATMARRAGKVIPREDLYSELSSHSSYDFKHGLNNAVQKIREVLGDSPENARFIETVPNRGYRFLPAVEAIYKSSNRDSNRISAAEGLRSDVPIVELKPALAAGPPLGFPTAKATAIGTGKRRRWVLWLAALVLLIAAAFVAYLYPLLPSRPRTNEVLPSLGSSDGKVRIAVIPFVNMSGDPGQEYVADGMTEEMIAQLGHLNPQILGVIVRTPAMQLKPSHKDAPQIAQELKVNYLLEGSIRREGKRVRVTALLIQANDQTYIWAETYDRDLSSVLKMQSDIAHTIAGEIQIRLAKPGPVGLQLNGPFVAVKPETRPAYEARSAYLEGMQALTWRTKEGCETAIADFKQSIAIDANYAPAYAGLARAYNLAPLFGLLTPAESFPQAAAAAAHAVSLNDTLSDAHSALGFTKAHWEFDWPSAEREFRKAINLEPNSANAHGYYSHSYLAPMGRHDEAITEIKKALELYPLSIPIESHLGRAYVLARRYDDALAQLKRTGDMDPSFAINHARLAHLYAHLHRFQDAIAEETQARLESGAGFEDARAHGRALTQAFEVSGARGYWLKELEFAVERENPPEAYVTPFGKAIIYSELGNKAEALRWLEKAYVERDIYVTELAVTAEFDFLRQEPRFQSLLRQTRLGK